MPRKLVVSLVIAAALCAALVVHAQIREVSRVDAKIVPMEETLRELSIADRLDPALLRVLQARQIRQKFGAPGRAECESWCCDTYCTTCGDDICCSDTVCVCCE